MDTSFYTVLAHEGVLAVRGTDAAKFLQGQLTCNMHYLNQHTAGLGARCTLKGRMLSTFRIVPIADGFLLAMAKELVTEQLAELKKFSVFFKVTLADESADWLRFGVYQADQLISEAVQLNVPAKLHALVAHSDLMAVRVAENYLELWAAATAAEKVVGMLQQKLPSTVLNAWLLAQIRAGVGQVFGATRNLFIPQMLNWQAVGGVSFKKGCYTGQEIVARMQYLGKLKRRMYRLCVVDKELPAPAAPIFAPVHDTSVGEVVLAAHAKTGIELLAVLQQDAVLDGRLYLGAEKLPVQLLGLPYSINPDQEIAR